MARIRKSDTPPTETPFVVRDVPEDVRRKVRVYAAEHDLTMGQALAELIETALGIGSLVEERIPPNVPMSPADLDSLTSGNNSYLVSEILAEVLSPRERLILQLRFGHSNDSNLPIEEVAKRVAISPERARDIEAAALAKLRAPDIRERLEATGAINPKIPLQMP